MCKHLSANWLPVCFSLWALDTSALCLTGDHALTSSFLDNCLLLDIFLLNVLLTSLYLLHDCDFIGYLLPQTGAIRQISPNMAAVHQGWFLGNTQYPVTCWHSTNLLQKGPKMFNRKILHSLGTFDFFAFSWMLHYSCGY